MHRIVFWNVNRKDLSNHVAEIAKNIDADALVLAENIQHPGTCLRKLKFRASSDYFIPDADDSSRFQCFSKRKILDLSEIYNGDRLSVRNLKIGSNNCLIGFVHGYDIRNHDEATLQSLTQDIADEVRFVQNDQKNQSVILLGDFNMNPYERGMNLARGWNAMMTKACASPGQRKFKRKHYDLYYNPMWSLFGDGTVGPPGTYYDTSNHGPYGWSMLDQVLVGHKILSSFEGVKIITDTGVHSLADSRGRPDRKEASDHFPIMIEINPKKE